jgi:hypothetical protein
MILAAWDVWDGTGQCTLGACMDVLDRRGLHMVATLLRAISKGRPEAIDGWLVTYDPRMQTGETAAYVGP